MPEAKRKYVLILCVLAGIISSSEAMAGRASRGLRRSVVKIYATTQRPNYLLPWQSLSPTSSTGSGFIIGKRRILTNAHVVSDARFLEVQKQDDPKHYKATVLFIAHDCDLAMLSVEDPSFFDGTSSLKLASELPELNDQVAVLGYPLGGKRLSMTRGVVSRIDYSTYSHSGMDQHLVLQVDAAINPGNSGGPVTFGKRVVGLAFQGLSWADNIGYAIPLPVIQRFLTDVEDGTYNGYAELGVSNLSLRNPALRKDLGLPDDMDGTVITSVDPFGSARELLRTRDVLVAIDGHDVSSDGTVAIDENRVHFAEFIERKQWGDSVMLDLWRDRHPLTLEIPLRNPHDPFIFRNRYDTSVRYLVRGGLVFSPMSREYLRTLRRESGASASQLSYFFEYAKVDGFHERFDEFVVFIRRLPHATNAYADPFLKGVVTRANGRDICNLEDLQQAWKSPVDGFHVLHFAGQDDTLVLPAAAVESAHAALLKAYGVPRDSCLEKE